MHLADPMSSASGRGPFTACAMEMGTIIESDVMLTYLQHMDEGRDYAPTAYALLMRQPGQSPNKISIYGSSKAAVLLAGMQG